ncbi:MAG: VTT domain-containing protein [Patescibacteria group bacterium]
MSISAVLDPQQLIAMFGLVGVIVIIFLESGVFFGFFFPGDSLLFTAGFLASQGLLPIEALLIGVFVAAVAGDSVGYWFGKKTGPRLFTKDNSFFFKKKYALQAALFYEKHGKKTLILARFMPIVRTFAPIVAGVGNMHYRTFLSYNVIGAFIWSVGLTLAGYFLGKVVPNADRYMLPIVILIILTSFIPPIFHYFKSKKVQKQERKEIV